MGACDIAPVLEALGEKEKFPSPPCHLSAEWIRGAWELISEENIKAATEAPISQVAWHLPSCWTHNMLERPPMILLILIQNHLILLQTLLHHLRQVRTACHRGGSPLPNLLPSLLPKLRTLLPNYQPRRKSTLQLESPFQCPLLSMCSSSRSSPCARQSGTQSLSLSRSEHASQQAVSGSFCGSYALMLACLASCHRSLLFPQGCGSLVTLAMLPTVWDTIMHSRSDSIFWGGGAN